MTHNANNLPSPESLIVLKVLREAVAEALERKRRLGQYAVTWEDGKIIFIGDENSDRPDLRQNSEDQ